MFSPEQFLEMQVTEASSTETIPVPVGEYTALIGEVKVRPWQKKDDPSVAGLTLDVTWEIDSPEVKELLGRQKVTCRQGIMLELTESGTLDMGKGRNVQLGRLREAVDLNAPGVPFSFPMLPGRMAKVKVTHRVDGDQIFAEIRSVAKLA